MKNFTQIVNDATKKLPLIGKLECVFSYFRSGQIFRQPISWLYLLIALAFFAAPFYFIYQTVGAFEYLDGVKIVAFILCYLLMIGAGVVGCMYWIDKSAEVSTITSANQKFVATPIISHMVRSFGEIVGLLTMTFLTLIAIVVVCFGANNLMPLGGGGVMDIVLIPVQGFVFIIITRFVSEMINALAAIANNTSKE